MDFRIVVDTREQTPYSFDCEIVRAKLDAGDYSVESLESRVAVERKSLQDFTGTVIRHFDRFAVELEKLAAMDSACIVVEADLDAMLRGQHKESIRQVAPASLLGSSIHIYQTYNIPVFWCGSRAAARLYTDLFLRSFVRRLFQVGEPLHA